MKIPLGDEIWDRLYGPYGNHRVDRMLITLIDSWDTTIAKKLFWEELHHQDDIYPATFASLPWLLEILPSNRQAVEETYLFLSHVIQCANSDRGTGYIGTEPQGTYPGLSTKIADHQHSWIPEKERLTVKDQPVLMKLKEWFCDNSPQIAERCLDLVGPDLVISTCAIAGFATLNGSSRVAPSTQMFADGADVCFIHRELGAFDDRDTAVIAQLYSRIHERQPELTSFLLDYPGCGFVPDDPRQMPLF